MLEIRAYGGKGGELWHWGLRHHRMPSQIFSLSDIFKELPRNRLLKKVSSLCFMLDKRHAIEVSWGKKTTKNCLLFCIEIYHNLWVWGVITHHRFFFISVWFFLLGTDLSSIIHHSQLFQQQHILPTDDHFVVSQWLKHWHPGLFFSFFFWVDTLKTISIFLHSRQHPYFSDFKKTNKTLRFHPR